MKLKLSKLKIYILSIQFFCSLSLAQELKEQKLSEIEVKDNKIDLNDSRRKVTSTATKIDLDLKDIPQTIENINFEDSVNYRKEDLASMLEGIPGVDSQDSSGVHFRNDEISIRGFSSGGGDIYLDGVRNGGNIRRSTSNIERAEIVKGPTSVLYGRGSGGGMVNLISRKANFESQSSIATKLGSWNSFGSLLDINQIINNNFVVRLTSNFESSDSFRKNIDSEKKMISPSILFQSDNEKFNWLSQFTYDKMSGVTDRPPNRDNLPENFPINISLQHPDDNFEDKLKSFNTNLIYHFNENYSIKYNFAINKSYGDFDEFFSLGYCDLNGNLLKARTTRTVKCNNKGFIVDFPRQKVESYYKTISNNLDLNTKFKTGFLNHNLLFGLDYSIEESDRASYTKAYNSQSINERYPEVINPYNPIWRYNKSQINEFTSHYINKSNNFGSYLQDLIDFNRHFKIMTGLRFDYYNFDFKDIKKNISKDYNDYYISPKIGLIFQPIKSQSVYVSFSKSFAPYGGRGAIGGSPTDTSLDKKPQYLNQYEIGFKSDWFNNKLSSQIAVFNLNLNNIRYQPDKINEPEIWEVRGKENSKGLEFSLNGKINNKLYLRGSFGYLQAKVIKDKQNPKNEGKYKPNIAPINANLFIKYLVNRDLYFEIGTTHKAKIYNNIENDSYRIKYNKFDALIGYNFNNWQFNFSINNLTDKKYFRSRIMPGTPRNYLLNAKYNF